MTDSTRPPKPWFRVEAKATTDSEPAAADVYVYDEIGESWWGGLSPKSLVNTISGLDVDEMTVHINSPGGAAWDGITIMNAIRAHRATVNVVVDGLAASAASIIAMAGDSITMNRGAQMMVHDASGGAWGNAQTMEETAGILHKLSDSLADVYAARTGGTREQWRDVMKAETWYTAEEAVAAGLADSWDGDEGAVDAVASFDMSRFRFQGRAQAPAPALVAAHAPDSPEPGNPNQKEGFAMSDALKAGLSARLGVTDAEITDEALLAAVDEALAEQAETTVVNTFAAPEGTRLVEDSVLAQMRADAAAGREARDEQIKARRDGVIEDAMRTGRITASSKDAFRAMLDANEEAATATIVSLAENMVPVAEIGHAAGEVSAEDALYRSAYGDDTEGVR